MLWWVAQNLIIVAILAATVSLICRCKRLSPAARHALWLVVLVKLLTPPLFVWPWGIPVSAETFIEAGNVITVNVKQDLNQPQALPFEEIETSLSGMAEVGDEEFPGTDSLIVSSETFVVPLNAYAENKRKPSVASTAILPEIQSRMQAEQRSVWKFERWVFRGSIIWITGMIVMAFWLGLRIWNMNRLVKNAQPAPQWLSRLLEETCVLLPVPAPQIFLVRGISTPLLWAWGRPMLLWPQELSQQLSPEAKQGVLLHELAHLKRKDHWVGRLELVAGCLWWPNPLFWYVRHQLRENAELACDAWVVQTLPNGRRDYADALLTVCQNYSHPAVPLPALGMGKSTRRTLERRLTMILRDRVPFRVSWWGMIAVLLLGVLTLPGWSQSKKETVPVPEAASKADVGDDLADPAAGDDVGSIKVPVVTAQELPTIIIKPPVEKAVTTERVVIQRYLEGKLIEELVNVERVNPNTARMRDRKLQELEEKLQALLGELRELRGKKDVSQSSVPKQESAADRKKAQTLFEQARSALKAGKQDLAKKLAIEASRYSGNYRLFEDRPDLILREVAKQELEKRLPKTYSARILVQRQKQAEEKQAEVVETKTITLVRTTYRINRVDAKSLEDLIKKIVKDDMMQIKITKRAARMMGSLGLISLGFEKTIIVTATPETQDYIGRLIALIEKAPGKKGPKLQKPSTKGRRGRFRQSSFPQGSQQPVREPERVFAPGSNQRNKR